MGIEMQSLHICINGILIFFITVINITKYLIQVRICRVGHKPFFKNCFEQPVIDYFTGVIVMDLKTDPASYQDSN